MHRKRSLIRFASGVVAFAVAAGAALLVGGVADAALPAGTLGTLTLTPASGSDQTAPQVLTSAGCPTTADSYIVTVNGPNKFDNLVLVSTISAGISHDGPFSTIFGVSMKDAASAANTSLVAGEYDVTLKCVDGLTQQDFGTFTTAMIFSDPTHYAVSGSTVGPSPSVTPSISPSPSVSPSPAASPSPSVSPSPSLWVSPSPTVIPTPVPGVQTTTIKLRAASGGSLPAGWPVTLIASVRPRAAVGTVQFKDGETNLGNPATVIDGTALTITSTLSSGTHSLTAAFTPADATAFNASMSPPVPLMVGAPISSQVQFFIQYLLQFILGRLHF